MLNEHENKQITDTCCVNTEYLCQSKKKNILRREKEKKMSRTKSQYFKNKIKNLQVSHLNLEILQLCQVKVNIMSQAWA